LAAKRGLENKLKVWRAGVGLWRATAYPSPVKLSISKPIICQCRVGDALKLTSISVSNRRMGTLNGPCVTSNGSGDQRAAQLMK